MQHPPMRNKPCLPQDFLRNGGTLEKLQQFFAIKVNRHSHYPELVQLRYDQLNSKMDDPLVQQCRGLILNESANWCIVARPFDKFFNYGDPRAPHIDWRNAHVQEKLDGTMIIFYWYKDFWHPATLGSPSAGGEVNGHNFNFHELFWRVWHSRKMVMPARYQEDMTLMFELMTPYNRVVVRHEDCSLRLIGIRSTWSGLEMQCRYQVTYDPVKEFRLQSIIDVEETFKTMDPLQQEGYVITDANFNRVKVKHPGYVAIHHMKEGFGPRRLLEVVRNAEAAELMASFPEWAYPLEQLQGAYEGLVMALEQRWKELKDISERRDFAMEAVKSIHPPTLFHLRDRRVGSVRESLKTVHIDRLMDILGVRDMDIQLEGSGL